MMKKYKHNLLGALILSSCALCGINKANAQMMDDPLLTGDLGIEKPVPVVKLPPVRVQNIPPLFWNPQELAIIENVKKGIVQFEPLDDKLSQELNDAMDNQRRLDGERYYAPRQITLSGLLYSSQDDWVVWLNGIRVTPDKKLKEIRSINVDKKLIEVQWFDAITDKVYPIRMRPHQKFDLDLQLFLPG